MSLAVFIRSHEFDIIQEWQRFARTCMPAAARMDSIELRNHIRAMLRFIVDDLGTPQTEKERLEKAKGQGQKAQEDSEAETHGEIRFTEGFDIMQVHAEFRFLRASVLKLWSEEWTRSNRDWITPVDIIPDLMRFNEAIDQMVSESLARYVRASGYSNPHNPADSAGSESKPPH